MNHPPGYGLGARRGLRRGDFVGESEMKCGTLRPILGHLEECCGWA